METAAKKTTSVSKQFVLVQTVSNNDVLNVVEKDIQAEKCCDLLYLFIFNVLITAFYF